MRVGDAIELSADRQVDLRHAVTMHVAPEAATAVEIPVAFAVDQMHPLGGGDDRAAQHRIHCRMCVKGCQRYRLSSSRRCWRMVMHRRIPSLNLDTTSPTLKLQLPGGGAVANRDLEQAAAADQGKGLSRRDVPVGAAELADGMAADLDHTAAQFSRRIP